MAERAQGLNKTIATDKKWYAIETKVKAEQKVLQLIQNNENNNLVDIEAYLPITTIKNKISPLFKGYIFVKHNDDGFHKMRYQPGVKGYVKFSMYPSIIPESQMALMEKVEANFNNVKTMLSHLVKGDKIKIIKGVLAGREGILTQDAEGKKIALAIRHLGNSLLIKVPTTDVIAI
ncbi:MAG: transcription antitermination factor NusG [Alteromonadaceae bacterium]|jgi:transcription antitermination factor NusG